jgi:hypothetical protein
MTQRQEVSFNVYNKTAGIVSNGQTFPFDIIDFNTGGGTYDTTNLRYTFAVAGNYLIGVSYVTIGGNNFVAALCNIRLTRNGVTTTINTTINAEQIYENVTTKTCFVYQFEVGDIIFCVALQKPKMNNFAYTTNDIYNSFWGIRLDY